MTTSELMVEISNLEERILRSVQADGFVETSNLASTLASSYELLGRKLQTESYNQAEVSAFILRRRSFAETEKTRN